MTIDFRLISPRSSGGIKGGQAPRRFDPFERHVPNSTTLRGHVIQIHYSNASRRWVSSPTPPTEISDGTRPSSPSVGVPAPPESEIPPRFSGGARGGDKLPHYSNYFLGRDSTNWRSRVSHYQSVTVPEVWPGIDIEYRADKQGVETIYHIKPGADPTQIQMEYLGLDAPLQIDSQRNLILATSLGEMKETAPFAFQQEARVQKRVESGYRVLDHNLLTFEFEGFDANKELVVDPLLYGTYLGGGAEDECKVITPAPDGSVYVAGYSNAQSGFPTTPGAYDETGLYPGSRLFCSHFGLNGEFIASTLYGEMQSVQDPNTDGTVNDLKFDADNATLWIVGKASGDWPLTWNAIDTIVDNFGDAYFMQFDDEMTELIYSSYLGGDGGAEIASAIDIDLAGRLHIVGYTASSAFPVTPDAFLEDMLGTDCFVWVFDPESRETVFSSYFGGNGTDFPPVAVRLDDNGVFWFAARTECPDIPVTDNAYQHTLADTAIQNGDVMIAGITLDPPTLVYCSYLGGGGKSRLRFQPQIPFCI